MYSTDKCILQKPHPVGLEPGFVTGTRVCESTDVAEDGDGNLVCGVGLVAEHGEEVGEEGHGLGQEQHGVQRRQLGLSTHS